MAWYVAGPSCSKVTLLPTASGLPPIPCSSVICLSRMSRSPDFRLRSDTIAALLFADSWPRASSNRAACVAWRSVRASVLGRVAQPASNSPARAKPRINHSQRVVGSVPQRIRRSFWAVVSTMPPQTLHSSGIQTEFARGTIPGGINRLHRGQNFRTGRRRIMGTDSPASSISLPWRSRTPGAGRREAGSLVSLPAGVAGQNACLASSRDATRRYEARRDAPVKFRPPNVTKLGQWGTRLRARRPAPRGAS